MAGISMQVVNMAPFLKAVADVPKVQLRFMRSEMKRGVARIRKSFIAKQLRGRPGIDAKGRLSKGGNIKAFVVGKTLKDLDGVMGISRLLHVHEKGMTIKATGKRGLLFIHAKGTGNVKDRPIVAVVPQVVIPKRLHFEQQVKAEGPAVLVKVAQASARATQVTLEKGLSRAI